jgi:multisubunit Na+/H+ antiporter MnhB subunit
MRLLRIIVVRTIIVVALVAIELEVIARRPGLWVTAAFTVSTVLLACCMLLSRLPAERHGQVDAPNTPAMRPHRVRITVRGMLIAVALLAIGLSPAHYWLYTPYYKEQANFHGMMARFCEDEAESMSRKAEACSARAHRGSQWDVPGKAAEDLKCCPYPSDVPRFGSWSEQAAVWERAAQRSMRAAERHSRISDYYSFWNLFPSRDL